MLLRQIRRLSKGRPDQVSRKPRAEALGSSAQGQGPEPQPLQHTQPEAWGGVMEDTGPLPRPANIPHPPLSVPTTSDEDFKEKEESDLGRETEMSPATAFFSTGPDTQPECRPSGWAELFPEHRCRPKGSSSVPHQLAGLLWAWLFSDSPTIIPQVQVSN